MGGHVLYRAFSSLCRHISSYNGEVLLEAFSVTYRSVELPTQHNTVPMALNLELKYAAWGHILMIILQANFAFSAFRKYSRSPTWLVFASEENTEQASLRCSAIKLRCGLWLTLSMVSDIIPCATSSLFHLMKFRWSPPSISNEL